MSSKKISPKTNVIINTILQIQKRKDIEETNRLSRKSTEKSKSRAQRKKDTEERVELIAKKQTLPSSMDFMELLKIGIENKDKAYVKKALDRGLSRLIPDLITFSYITADLDIDNVFLGKLLKDINKRIKITEYATMDDYLDLVELKNEIEKKLGMKPKTNRSRSKSMI